MPKLLTWTFKHTCGEKDDVILEKWRVRPYVDELQVRIKQRRIR